MGVQIPHKGDENTEKTEWSRTELAYKRKIEVPATMMLMHKNTNIRLNIDYQGKMCINKGAPPHKADGARRKGDERNN